MLRKIRNKLHRRSKEDAEIAQKSVEPSTEQSKTTAAATTSATPSEELRSSKESIHEEYKPTTETTQEMNTQRSDITSSASTASSGAGALAAGLSSGQAPLSSAGLATRTSAGIEAGAVSTPSGLRDEVFIREEKKLPTSLPPHDIELEKIQKDLAAEKVALMNKINQSKAAIANAEKDLFDHQELITRNEQTINTCRANAAEFMRLENIKEEAKRAALEEERRLETLRSKKHEEAVMLENERADFKAKRIASEQQEQQARQLIEYHKESLLHSNKYITAHKTLIDSLNSQLSVLDQTVDIHVLGERARVGEQTIGVTVEVKPEVLPEARVIPTVLPTVKAAGAAIEEHSIPGPEFVPVHVKAEQVAHSAERVERLKIEE